MNPADPPPSRGIGLPPKQFAAAFPFHFATDESLALVQIGATLGRLCPDVRPDARIDEVFRPVRPHGSITIDWVLAHSDHFFLLEHRRSGLQLRGQFIALPEEKQLVFIGSPWFTDASEIAARGLRFDDFAIHDPVVDLLQIFQSSKMALADAKKLAAKLSVQREELRGANERLRHQEREARQLALIAARTDNAVVLTDATGVVLWVNDGFTRLTGYTLDDVRGRKPGAVLQGPGTDPATVQRIRERLQRSEGFTAEILNYRKDGREYWAAIEVQPIVGGSGQVENYMSIESDITERRAAAQRLAMQFEVASVLAESDDRQEAFRQVLEVMCQRLGWQLGQIWLVTMGRVSLAQRWHLQSTQLSEFVGACERMSFALREGLPGRVMETGEPFWAEEVTRDPNFLRADAGRRAGLRGAVLAPIAVHGQMRGVLEFFSVKPERVDEALLRTFATVAVQIGEFIRRHDAQQAVRRSEERFRSAFDDAYAGVALVGLDSRFVQVNPALCEMLGYAKEELVGRSFVEITHPADVPISRETIRRVHSGELERIELEIRYVRKDGQVIWVLIRSRRQRDAGGGPDLLVSHYLDITARKEAEQSLRHEKRLLEEAQQRELQTGYEIQRTLLIGEVPALDLGVEIAAYAVPSRGIDGDFYAFTRFRGDCFELVVGDVMGKGVPAALVGAAVRTTYNQVVTELVAASFASAELPSPAAIMNALHARLTPRLIELETFVTVALYRFDLAAGRLTSVNAGHTAGLLASAEGGVAGVLGANLPVGVLADERYVERTMPLCAGDALLVYSDGLTDARDRSGAQFGEERLRDVLARLRPFDLPPAIQLQALRRAVREFAGSEVLIDDQSAVLAVVRSLAAAGSGTRSLPEVFELPWEARGLGALRDRVAAAGAGLGTEASAGLVLGAFEAATNVVRHVPRPFPDATLSCRIVPGANSTTVEIWYLGEGFEPPAEPQPDFSGNSDGGFGLYIMAHAVDHVVHESPLPGVCCTRLTQTSAPTTAA
jgi:PAS domain S-box-containing protein